MQPPKATKIPTELNLHNHNRVDNYFWLKQRDHSEVLEYLKSEQDYSNDYLSSLQEDISTINSEFLDRIVKSRQTVPFFQNGYYYYYSYSEQSEYPMFFRSVNNEINLQNDECILDVQKLSEGTSFCSVGKIAVSKNNKLVVFSLDTIGRRQYNLFCKNLETQEVFSLDLPHKTSGNVIWCEDNETIVYTITDSQTLRSFQVWTYNIVSKKLHLLYEEVDSTYRVVIYTTNYQSALFIVSVSTLTTEVRMCSLANPTKTHVVMPRSEGIEYYVYDTHNGVYVYTNHNAKNFRLMLFPTNKDFPSLSSVEQIDTLQEIIPHNEFVKLEQVLFFETFFIYQQRTNGTEHLFVAKYDSSIQDNILIPEKEYSILDSNNHEYSTNVFRFALTTLRTPITTYEYNVASKQSVLIKEEPLAVPYDKEHYETYRIYATAKDTVKIAITLVHKKGIVLDSTSPLLLYGYGSYGITIDPNFSSERLSLLERGFVYAIAHVRGEQFFGRGWYEDGKLLNKMNTFTDFIACAEELIAKKYTSASKLVAMGGSAGGLLMGAIANLRPDLFAGIISLVPFVDVVTTMLDDSIPLTTSEYDEWGNPNDKEYYDYMLSYSPYDNIKPQDYPPMLVVTGYHDSQVQYWEPAKYVAKLRELKTDDNPLLFQINFEAGHGGASGRFSSLKEIARNYAFIINCVK